ncbi:MAG: twin-arginine translocation signal domain-containing protein [Christensenellales bacterium]
MAQISRRDFLKGTAAGAVGLAALGIVPSAGHAKASELTAQQAMAKLNPQDYDFRSKDTDMAAIFSEWNFGSLKLNHRMVKSAAGSDTSGNPQELVAYYEAFAKGGVEMVWVEDFLQLYPHFINSRKKDPANMPLAELVKAVHDAGGYIGYQLSCMGQKFSGLLCEIVIHGETGVDMEIACDTVIEAMDMLPNTELIEGLGDKAIAVGDCNRPWNIAEAIAAGNIAARNI